MTAISDFGNALITYEHETRVITLKIWVDLRIPSMVSDKTCYNLRILDVIAQGCGQTLGLGLVDRNRTVVNY